MSVLNVPASGLQTQATVVYDAAAVTSTVVVGDRTVGFGVGSKYPLYVPPSIDNN